MRARLAVCDPAKPCHPQPPLVSPALAQFVEAWKGLPSLSSWLLHTIRLGYTIQFLRHPPRYRGVHFTSVLSERAPVMGVVPPADMKTGFYSPYFIVTKKGSGFEYGQEQNSGPTETFSEAVTELKGHVSVMYVTLVP
ncbi:hypothetical protein PO909_003920 [Leuciscus waleckii]